MCARQHPALDLVEERLGTVGFERVTSRLYTRETGSEVIGWLCLHTWRRTGGGLLVEPSLGVRYQHVEHVVAMVSGRTPSAAAPPTWSRPLSTLAPGIDPDALVFEFTGTARDAATAQWLADAVGAHGLPFIATYSDADTLLAEMSHHLDLSADPATRAVYVVPALLFMRGEHQRARETVASLMASLGSPTDGAARDLRGYLDRLVAHYGRR